MSMYLALVYAPLVCAIKSVRLMRAFSVSTELEEARTCVTKIERVTEMRKVNNTAVDDGSGGFTCYF